MSGVNKAIIVGRLGKDPEVRHLENGASVANFSVATSEVYKDRNSGERKEQTEWHNVVLWRGLAEVAEKYLKKGDMVYIEGKLRTRSWEKEGTTRYTTEIVGDNMTMLGSAGGGSGNTPSQNQTEPKEKNEYEPAATRSFEEPQGEATDDLPF